MSYQAEYIWIDGTEPSPLMRCKTRIVGSGKEPGIWGFDGSSTNQAPGHNSDCVLRPVFTCPDTLACMNAGLSIEGTNAEVMMGQWEFQIGVLPPPLIGDEIWTARWLLYRIAEPQKIDVSLDAKPRPGDWNGAGAHTNFSTAAMRESYDAIIVAAEALGERAIEHIDNYGPGIKERLTGAHETARWDSFTWGASDRGASVRIPWAVEKAKKGWLEDRRPNANMDPYVVTRLMVETCCEALQAMA